MRQEIRSRIDEAVKLKQAKKFDLAWEAFSSLAAENPRSSYFWSNYAHLALRMNRQSQARQFIERALSIKPDNQFTKALYAEILLYEGDIDNALPIIRELIEEKPNVLIIKKLLRASEKQKRLEELKSDFQNWIQRYHKHSELLTTAAEFYHKIGETDRAIEYYQTIVNDGKASDFEYERLIALKTHGKSSAEKIKQLETLLKVPSQRKNIHLLGLLAQELKKNKEWEKAEKIYREILKLAPNSVFHKKQMGFLFIKTGNTQQAIEILSDCLLRDPDDTYIRTALLSAYKKERAKREALQLIEQILFRYPDKKNYYGIRKKVEKWK